MKDDNQAVSIIEKLIKHLDEAHPKKLTDPLGREVIIKDWLNDQCFEQDHELYDDLLDYLGQTYWDEKEIQIESSGK